MGAWIVIKFVRSRDRWGSPEFKLTLKSELEQLDVSQLPLVQGMTQGSVPLDGSVEAMVLNGSETDDCIHAKVGLFYKSVIAGCSCADDPTPVSEVNEYCEIQLNIDRSTASSTIELVG